MGLKADMEMRTRCSAECGTDGEACRALNCTLVRANSYKDKFHLTGAWERIRVCIESRGLQVIWLGILMEFMYDRGIRTFGKFHAHNQLRLC